MHILIVVIAYFISKGCGTPNKLQELKKDGRIINGIPFTPHYYPWLALLQLNDTLLCGGTLISENFVLSAAHCWNKRYELVQIKVLLGKHNRCEGDNKSVLVSVSEIIRHPRFNSRNFHGDIMLLKLSLKLSFTTNIRPVCLPTFDVDNNISDRYRGRRGIVIGWGKRDTIHKQPSCQPQQLIVPILDRKQCNNSNLAPSLFCAGYLQGGRDSCQGDSGGPMQILNKFGRYEIIGNKFGSISCCNAILDDLVTS